MKGIVASLAAVLASLAALGLAGCGDDGAEPDAPQSGATTPAPTALDLVLDFQPNPVHTGIYVAEQRGIFAEHDLDVSIREPGASTDAPKLLRSGRADLAILDIHDLAIAHEQGADLVGIAAIVQRPLASVIAADGLAVRNSADLEGATVGVTGLPSDDAVLESVLEAGDLGLDDVATVTIGFEAAATLLAGQVDAATAFWNVEGVTLAEQIPTREFRIDDFGAPRYPELVLVTTPENLAAERESISEAVEALDEGYAATVADPDAALDDLLAAVPELDPDTAATQLDAVLDALGGTRRLNSRYLYEWSVWEAEREIVKKRPVISELFDLDVADRPPKRPADQEPGGT